MSQAPDARIAMRSVLDEVQAAITEINPDLAGLDGDADLREAGLDSMGIAALIVALETRFGMVFSSDALTDENFRTPARVAATVAHLSVT